MNLLHQTPTYKKHFFKFVVGWVFVFAVRLIPFRPPNIEPVLAVQMPFSKHFGKLAGFLFAFLNIILFDSLTSGIGMWTWITAFAYGLLGVLAGWFFKNRASSRLNYAVFAIIATILYDAVTGLTIGPLLFGQSFMEALVGQIPFTLRHLLGNTLFAVIVSPILYSWIVVNSNLETASLKRAFFKAA
jgi:uncharacterized membrane protein